MLQKTERRRSDIFYLELNELEIKTALSRTKNGKSPGTDGLTIEFYKIFWNTMSIKNHLLQ